MSIEQYPAANGVLTSLIWRKTATGGETSLSGYDNATQALSYTPGQEQVYLNGILLVRGSDYTATNGTSITGLTALVVDDFIQINCYNNFSVASVPTASLTGTVTNAQLAGSIANDKLTNSSITINGSAVALGGSVSLPGDIESVTASTGLSGGGNTGALTLTNTMATAIDAKGDLVVGTGADAFSKLTVGANGTVLTAASGEATGLSWTTPPAGGAYAAGKNKIINGDFGVWQRGTSFAMAGSGLYTSDRWNVAYSGATGATVSQYVMTSEELNNFTYGYSLPGTLTDASGTGYLLVRQPIEDVRTLSNQTATISFYAKGSAAGTIGIRLTQDFGTGGSASAAVAITPQTQAITTTWTRYSLTFSIPSIASKTIGTNPDSKLYVNFDKNIGAGNSIGYGTNPNFTGTLSITGVQLEAGSVVTAFQTATGTIQGELAACQRYYYRTKSLNGGSHFGVGMGYGSTNAIINVPFPVTMRIRPTALEQSGTAGDYSMYLPGSSSAPCNAVPTMTNSSNTGAEINAAVSSGLSAGGATIFQGYTTNAFLGFGAEL